MANKVTNTLITNITSTEDTTANVDINRGINLSFDSFVAQFNTYQLLVTGPTVITFPLTNPLQLYVRNIDPTSNITVIWTPNGQASATILKLSPGDLIMFWQNPANSGQSIGITSLSLSTTAAGGTLVEYFIGG